MLIFYFLYIEKGLGKKERKKERKRERNNGTKWQRANYSTNDGYEDIGLLDACSIHDTTLLSEFASDAPGLNGNPPPVKALAALVAADGKITQELLEAVVPGWDIDAGIAAARKFI